MESIVDSLHDILANIEIDGDFAASGLLDEASNPGLHVEGLGNIELPVSQRDLEGLISKSKQSAFGFKSETRIDLNVRKTWEIQADQIRFDHPSWPAKLRQIIDNVSTALRVPMGVEAKLNKLLIYEKGGKFDKHKDSEKENGMFGTLVITLPMKHKGGDILLEHHGMKKVFKSAPTSSYRMSYMAWYADVSHQVRKVETGNRIALTYNLIHAQGGTGLSAEEQYSDLSTESDLHQLLTEFKELPEAKKPLIYQLDHKYTEANMRLDHLKGLDKKRCDMLYSAAKASDFSVFLASMEKSISGGYDEFENFKSMFNPYFFESCSDESDGDESCDDKFEDNESGNDDNHGYFHKIIEVCDESVSLRKVFDLDGHRVAIGVHIQEDQVVQGEQAFKKIDDEECSGWTGNEGVSATHFYRSTVVVLIPRIHEVEAFFEPILKEGQTGIDRWLRRTIEECRVAGPNLKAMISEKLETFINFVVRGSSLPVQTSIFDFHRPNYQKASTKIMNGRSLDLAATAAVAANNGALLLKVLLHCEQAQPSMWFMLGNAIRTQEFSSTQSNFHEALEKYDFQAVADVLAQLNNGLQGRKLSNNNNFVQPSQTMVQDYLQITMEHRLNSNYSPTKNDGEALATLCNWFPGLAKTIFLPFVSKHKSNSAFGVAFLASIQRQELNGNLEIPKANILSLQTEVIKNLNILGYYSVHEKKSWQHFYQPFSKEMNEVVPDEGNISSAHLAEVLFHCIRNDDEQLAGRITIQLLGAASHTQETIFSDMLIPFLYYFIPLFEAMTAATNYTKTWNAAGFVKAFLSPLLERCLVRYVLEEVANQGPNWKLTRVGCGCKDCDELNRFLTSATESIGRFSIAGPRRKHLENRLRAGAGEYLFDTERDKSPHTLIVTKRKDAAAKKQDELMARRKAAETFIKKLQRHGLGAVMGTDDTQAILTRALTTSKPLSKANANQRKQASLGPGAGSKHRLDQQEQENPVVIDLT